MFFPIIFLIPKEGIFSRKSGGQEPNFARGFVSVSFHSQLRWTDCNMANPLPQTIPVPKPWGVIIKNIIPQTVCIYIYMYITVYICMYIYQHDYALYLFTHAHTHIIYIYTSTFRYWVHEIYTVHRLFHVQQTLYTVDTDPMSQTGPGGLCCCDSCRASGQGKGTSMETMVVAPKKSKVPMENRRLLYR